MGSGHCKLTERAKRKAGSSDESGLSKPGVRLRRAQKRSKWTVGVQARTTSYTSKVKWKALAASGGTEAMPLKVEDRINTGNMGEKKKLWCGGEEEG